MLGVTDLTGLIQRFQQQCTHKNAYALFNKYHILKVKYVISVNKKNIIEKRETFVTCQILIGLCKIGLMMRGGWSTNV